MLPTPISGFHFRDVLAESDVIAWPQGPGEPLTLTRALMAQRHELRTPGLFLGMVVSDTVKPEHADVFAMRGLNGAGSNRRLTAAGVLDVIPTHVSTVPALLRSRHIGVDVALVQVRRHPTANCYTLGVIADYTQALIRGARVVIAELNESLPVTGQDALVDPRDIDLIVESAGDVIELPDPLPDAQEDAVAQRVAAVIPDGATLQLGIGAMPVAVARALGGHRDLGIHSGVISDAVVELFERGAVTNARKDVDRGCLVTGGLFGTRRLYAFADGNSAVHMRSVEYTHDQSVLRAMTRLFTINGAIEVDATGQVNAEVAGGRYLGAVGGQVDFVRGGFASPEGRSIIALPATTRDETRSRIVVRLSDVAVTTARSDVDLVVTEFGVADLRGQSMHERARRLIAVAHPKFREELSRDWRDAAQPSRARDERHGSPAATTRGASSASSVAESTTRALP
jgi:acyl-CoA hydrolase